MKAETVCLITTCRLRFLLCIVVIKSNQRQTYSVDFLIDVERINVGHSADIVDNSHDARFEVGRAYVILAAYAADELARVEPLRIDSRLGHDLHQAVHNLKTAQFDVKYRLALVDFFFESSVQLW